MEGETKQTPHSLAAVLVAMAVGASLGLAVALVVSRGCHDVYASYRLGQIQRDRAYNVVLRESLRDQMADEEEWKAEQHIHSQNMQYKWNGKKR